MLQSKKIVIVIARYWCIKDFQDQMLLDNALNHKEWLGNTEVGAETIVLLKLAEMLEKNGSM